jgi:hypothetical protein
MHSLGDAPAGNWVEESVVLSLVVEQPYTYKPLPESQMMAEQEMNENSNATVLMANNVTNKSLSPSQETKVRNMVLEDSRTCDTGLSLTG